MKIPENLNQILKKKNFMLKNHEKCNILESIMLKKSGTYV